MNASAPLQADRDEISRFVQALFSYATEGTFVSLRSFYDDRDGVFAIRAHRLSGLLDDLVEAAWDAGSQAARAPNTVVFAPPVATFVNDRGASEADLAEGLALSVECDSHPVAARARLETLLGPATIVVASGGEWVDPQTREVEPKLHLHWRLTEPTRDPDSHAALKEARALAAEFVGGDGTNKPVVHPIRWPGSWHRKAAPRLTRIMSETEAELDLQDALERLREASGTAGSGAQAGRTTDAGTGESRGTDELITAILTGTDYHAPLAALAMRYLKGGMADSQVVLTLRGLMDGVPAAIRDIKDGTHQPGRWQARYDDIPRAVATARAKIGDAERGETDWPEPVDFLADDTATGAPELRADHLPEPLWPFVIDTAGRMGVDPTAVALAALVSCASVAHEEWRLQPKRHDTTWTEAARLWGAIVGDPSILKTPVIAACTRPIEALEAEARRCHAEQMARYKAEQRRLKASGGDPESLGPPPRLVRYMVEGTTVEALSEVLRDDEDAKQLAPCGRVLACQDEMSEWVASFDRYRSGGRGGGDRGAYLRLFNGGRYVVDRVGRGSFAVPSWSACVLGGIQPEPIRRIAEEAADDGLLQRFLYCVPARQEPGLDRAPDQAAITRYEEVIANLVLMRPKSNSLADFIPAPHMRRLPALTLAPAGQAHRESIDALARTLAALPDTSGRMKAALGKWPGVFARLCLLFHLIEAADPLNGVGVGAEPPAVVEESTARRVLALMRDVLLPHVLRAEAVMFSTAQTGHARWIAGFILARAGDRVTQREIVQAYGAFRAPERRRELQDVMESLVAMAWLKPETPLNATRAPTAWSVNPAVHSRFARRAEAERTARRAVQEDVAARARAHAAR